MSSFRYKVLSILLAWLAAGQAATAESLVVIVPVERQAQVTADDVAQIYLRKRRFWNDGEPIVPVNRNAGSDERRLFTRALFRNEARRLATYWNRQYFRGVLPPATLASDEAVKRFVASEPNAIGYIDADAVDNSVRVILHLSTQ
jgi:ABC-type phosphate transport system substrate-binding protein